MKQDWRRTSRYARADSNYLLFCCGNDFEILEPENCHTIFLILTWWHFTSNREFITVVTSELSCVAKQLLGLFFCEPELFCFISFFQACCNLVTPFFVSMLMLTYISFSLWEGVFVHMGNVHRVQREESQSIDLSPLFYITVLGNSWPLKMLFVSVFSDSIPTWTVLSWILTGVVISFLSLSSWCAILSHSHPCPNFLEG